ncbi:MAG: RNA-guided pseudouridylation complex pseudouridine synthase subunit Cbf5 [Candidatus Pacearchaeota archaeon]|nr:RNA-guided pseudouridylation complex pseudouridine synthase subunit Cbf5 [Candidatus Pacearchaeota archaeon]
MNIEKIKQNKSTEELLEFGIINIDKSSGPTSFNVSDFVKKNLGLRKTSHFGTLDPKVTGVLPIALNRACKLTGYFLGEDKEYIGIMRMHEEVSFEKIKEVIKNKFSGTIKQTPPLKSRVKREEREREIKNFELLEEQGKDILFKVACQGGTYIRKLVDDLGSELGIGAHMLELRRVRAGIFKENDELYPCVNLYDFEKAVLEYKKGNDNNLRKIIIPAEIVSEVYKVIKIKKEEIKRLWSGKPIFTKDVVSKPGLVKDEIVCVFSDENFIGMYKVIKGKDIFAKPEFVMQPIKE